MHPIVSQPFQAQSCLNQSSKHSICSITLVESGLLTIKSKIGHGITLLFLDLIDKCEVLYIKVRMRSLCIKYRHIGTFIYLRWCHIDHLSTIHQTWFLFNTEETIWAKGVFDKLAEKYEATTVVARRSYYEKLLNQPVRVYWMRIFALYFAVNVTAKAHISSISEKPAKGILNSERIEQNKTSIWLKSKMNFMKRCRNYWSVVEIPSAPFS